MRDGVRTNTTAIETSSARRARGQTSLERRRHDGARPAPRRVADERQDECIESQTSASTGRADGVRQGELKASGRCTIDAEARSARRQDECKNQDSCQGEERQSPSSRRQAKVLEVQMSCAKVRAMHDSRQSEERQAQAIAKTSASARRVDGVREGELIAAGQC